MKFVIATVALLALLPCITAQDDFIRMPDIKAIVNQLPHNQAAITLTNELVTADECRSCVHKTAHHILHGIWGQIKDNCKNATGVEKARCDYLEKHENRTLGYLSVEARPGLEAYGYCIGAGKCKHPNATLEYVPSGEATDAFTLEQSLNSLTRVLADYTPEQQDKQAAKWEKSMDKLEGKIAKQWSELDEDQTSDDESKQCIICSLCLKFVTKHVLKGKIKHVIKTCKNTKCPVIKKWCEWANTHRDFVHGQIYAKVEPYKYAIGACIATRACRHPRQTAITWDSMMGKSHHEDDDQ